MDPDLVVVDIGIQLLSHITQQGKYTSFETSTVFFSYSLVDLRADVLQMGMERFLPHLFNRRETTMRGIQALQALLIDGQFLAYAFFYLL